MKNFGLMLICLYLIINFVNQTKINDKYSSNINDINKKTIVTSIKTEDKQIANNFKEQHSFDFKINKLDDDIRNFKKAQLKRLLIKNNDLDTSEMIITKNKDNRIKTDTLKENKNMNILNRVNLKSKTDCAILNCLECGFSETVECKKCSTGYHLNNKICIDIEKLNNYIQVLSQNLPQNQIDILKAVINKIKDPEFNLTNYSEFKAYIKEFNENSKRDCHKKVNTYLVDFNQQLNSLIDLSNLIEEKSEIQLRSLSNKVMSLIDRINKDSSSEIEIKFKEISDLVETSFNSITKKISNFEELSNKKLKYIHQGFQPKIASLEN